MYLSEDDLVEVKTCRRNITSDYVLLLTGQFVGLNLVFMKKEVITPSRIHIINE